jgi:hypothetical protein
MSARAVRRAGLDYKDAASVVVHSSWAAFRTAVPTPRVFAISKFGEKCYADVHYERGDVLLFGSETSGLPAALKESARSNDALLRLPMRKAQRSLSEWCERSEVSPHFVYMYLNVYRILEARASRNLTLQLSLTPPLQIWQMPSALSLTPRGSSSVFQATERECLPARAYNLTPMKVR